MEIVISKSAYARRRLPTCAMLAVILAVRILGLLIPRFRVRLPARAPHISPYRLTKRLHVHHEP